MRHALRLRIGGAWLDLVGEYGLLGTSRTRRLAERARGRKLAEAYWLLVFRLAVWLLHWPMSRWA